jgi:hypothetical protein
LIGVGFTNPAFVIAKEALLYADLRQFIASILE